MAAEINADAFLHAKSPHETELQVGFTPSPMLNAALRGFLLSEQSGEQSDQEERTRRKIGNIMLRSLRRQAFSYDKHPDGDIRYIHDAQIVNEEKRIERIRDDIITVSDITLAVAGNQDMLVGLRLNPTYEQRDKLSGLVLGDLAEGESDAHLDVYARLRRQDVVPYETLVRQARELRHKLALYRAVREQRPLDNIRNPYFVRAPKVISADPIKPRITL